MIEPNCAARSRPPVAELGLQVDLSASAGSLFVLTGFAALQLKVRAAIEKREARDAARETLRKAEVLLLAGKLEADAVERAREAANSALAAYEDERKVAALGGVALRIPDPTPERAADSDAFSLEKREDQGDALDPLRATLGLKNPEAPPSEEAGSLLPTGSRQLTLKDFAIGFVFVLQVAWFCLSLTDPMAGGGNGLPQRHAHLRRRVRRPVGGDEGEPGRRVSRDARRGGGVGRGAAGVRDASARRPARRLRQRRRVCPDARPRREPRLHLRSAGL